MKTFKSTRSKIVYCLCEKKKHNILKPINKIGKYITLGLVEHEKGGKKSNMSE